MINSFIHLIYTQIIANKWLFEAPEGPHEKVPEKKMFTSDSTHIDH